MLRLYDGNNVARVAIEGDITGLGLRNTLNEAEASPDVCVWVWDGVGANQRRRALFPEYKANRQPPAENIYASIQLLKSLLRSTKAISVEVPGYEADDVIATIARTYLSEQIEIRSTDKDYRQLARPGLTFTSNPLPCGDHLTRLFKATVGDPNDNIKGIRLFGPKSFDAAPKDELYHFVVDDWPTPSWLPTASVNWCSDPANRALLKTYWDIIGFYDVPAAEIERGTVVGQSNPARISEELNKWML